MFVAFPIALWAVHPTWHFCFGHPKIIGNFIGFVFATVKEFVWDEDIESAIVRGSNWRDWAFYMVGMIVTDLILWM